MYNRRPIRIDMLNWNDQLFEGLKAVNRNLNAAPLPAKAEKLLRELECCLCSGDGLTEESAFKAVSLLVVDRMLGVTGMRDEMECSHIDGETLRVQMGRNRYGIESLYFTVRP